MRILDLILIGLLVLTPQTVMAYDGKKPLLQQDQLPASLKTGKQIRIENSHYLILDQVRAYDTNLLTNNRAVQNSQSKELSRKGHYSIQSQSIPSIKSRPVVWNQTTQRYALLLDELGLVLNENSTAEAIAQQYDMTLAIQIKRLNRAYFHLDANRIPDLMRELQQDMRVKKVLPSLLENTQ